MVYTCQLAYLYARVLMATKEVAEESLEDTLFGIDTGGDKWLAERHAGTLDNNGVWQQGNLVRHNGANATQKREHKRRAASLFGYLYKTQCPSPPGRRSVSHAISALQGSSGKGKGKGAGRGKGGGKGRANAGRGKGAVACYAEDNQIWDLDGAFVSYQTTGTDFDEHDEDANTALMARDAPTTLVPIATAMAGWGSSTTKEHLLPWRDAKSPRNVLRALHLSSSALRAVRRYLI